MPPTNELDFIRSSSSSPVSDDEISRFDSRLSCKDPFDITITLEDFDNSCETYFCSRDSSPSPRSVIPGASPAFLQALGKMKAETTTPTDQTDSSVPSSPSSPSSPRSSSTSKKQRGKSSTQKSSSSSSSSSCSSSSSFFSSQRRNDSDSSASGRTSGLSATTSQSKRLDSRRPASFGGADVVKPRTGRRASHHEKRVSWADERGSDHQLINVRLIRPRIASDANTGVNSAPGHSILRNTGTSSFGRVMAPAKLIQSS